MPWRQPEPQTVAVDRIACTGHGACHALQPTAIPLDEWGYPIPSRLDVTRAEARELIDHCPAAALRRI